MKKTLLIGCLIVSLIGSLMIIGNLAIFSVQGSTEVAGIITSDTTWTQANSPYNLTNNVLVNQNVTLTIEPGVAVNLNDYYIMVNGTLIASGNSTSPISFNSGEITFTEYSQGWNASAGAGCIIENSVIDCLLSIESSVKLSKNTIYDEITVDGGVTASIVSNNLVKGGINVGSNGMAVISNNTITSQGITLDFRSLGNADILVTDNLIIGCSIGIQISVLWVNPSSAVLEKNLIVDNGIGIAVLEWVGKDGSSQIMRNNTITDNNVGISIDAGSDHVILNNNIYNNIEYNFKSTIPTGVNATYNWWGTTNTSTIDQFIYDFYDDFELGEVTYLPILDQPNPNAPVNPIVYSYDVSVDTQSYKIAALSTSNISEFDFNKDSKLIEFNVEGATGTTGFCSITIPEDLMFGTFTLYKDDTLLIKDWDYTETYNGTHYIFQIFYNHSVHTFQIFSSEVVPELPPRLLFTLILVPMFAAVVMIRKKLLKSRS